MALRPSLTWRTAHCGGRGEPIDQFFVRRDANSALAGGSPSTAKGDKQWLVPATRKMMMDLSCYRQQLCLSAPPSPNEATPLVLSIGARASDEGIETCAPLHAIVKDVFTQAAAHLRERDDTASARADVLEKSSAHWLRRGAVSHMADQNQDLRMVRGNLGHASLTTTGIISQQIDRPSTSSSIGTANT